VTARSCPCRPSPRWRKRRVAPQLSREQQLRAVSLSAGLKDGLALGEALSLVQEMAEPLLPEGSRLMPMAEAATLQENSNGLFITFGFALAIIFLLLAAQFESFVHPGVIIMTVPLAVAGGMLGLFFFGKTLNLYSQIGIVMLVGLAAKNGILIVEFANQLRDEGKEIADAIRLASARRLRAILMTSIATAAGAVPLMIASGAGAEARISLGWVLVGGLGLATVVTLYLTPVAYLVIARYHQPACRRRKASCRRACPCRDAGAARRHGAAAAGGCPPQAAERRPGCCPSP
jgi:HAE1 family hydrophobic/amphiphilic exporter-1